jgi:membrane associated rhomboid family serine protease
MNEPDFQSAPAAARPRTATVLTLLAGAAAIFSYLGAYAMVSALLKAEMLKPWPPTHDPRPKWFIISFAILLSIFFLIGLIARNASDRQIRRIDEMEEESAEN